jgi:hypothetical protein
MRFPFKPIAVLLGALLCLYGFPVLAAEESAPAASGTAAEAPAFKPEEIEQLVAPIALYPDPLLAQVLMASTYPLEIVQAARWAKANPQLKDEALEDALQQQTWDPSVKSLTAVPQVLTMMNDKLDWTQKLGDAFLAQQADVMDAVQRLRAKANAEGNLQTNKEQKVIVEQAPAAPVQQNVTVEAPPAPAQTTIIKIEPANPQVVYVPTYNPTVVYGAWPYPAYPPYYYYPPGYVATASLISFGVGVAVGSALWGGCHWGGWGHSDVNINVNRYNNFNRTNISNNSWQHNVEHRKGVQYRDQRTQQRYSPRASQRDARAREQFRGRAEQGRQQLARTGTTQRSGAKGGGTRRDTGKVGGGKPGAQARAGQQPRPQNRQANPQSRRPSSPRSTASGGGRSPSAFGNMGSGASTRAASDRGRASRQSASSFTRGGGGARGGGRRGGGRRR